MASSTKLRAVLELPDELFGLILSKLPLLYMFQLRLVCKQWNIHDIDFLEKCFRLTRRAPLCFWPTERGFASYCPEMNRWDFWPTSLFFMEGSWFKAREGRSDESPRPRGCWDEVVGGADGMLLVESAIDYERTLYLTNPMTGSHKKLTQIQNRDFQILGMVLDESSKSYKIFGMESGRLFHSSWNHALGDYELDSSSEEDDEFDAYEDIDEIVDDYRDEEKLDVYDSKLDSWKAISIPRRRIKRIDLPVFQEGVLHFLTTKYVKFEDDEVAQRIKVFWLDSGESWQQLTAPMPNWQALHFSHLFEWHGNLMLIVAERTEGKEMWQNTVYRLGVWQLDEEKYIWIERTAMPYDLLDRFSGLDPMRRHDFRYHSGGDYLYFTSYSTIGWTTEFVRHVMCNLSTNSWWEVPDPFSGRLLLHNACHSFLVEPSLKNID